MKMTLALNRFLIWRTRHINDKQFILLLSVVVGFLGGSSAVIIKNGVHFIQKLLTDSTGYTGHHYFNLLYPAIGILLVIIFIRFILRQRLSHGIPIVLHAISRKKGILAPYQMYASIITSVLTVGFGGSVGLEGPTIGTGASIGSNLGRILNLSYKQIILMIGVASAAAMASIFQAPIAAMLFAVEVIMIDLTAFSIIPLLIASATAVLTSYFLLGQAVLYPFEIEGRFQVGDAPYYILLGIFAGGVSVYFTKIYILIEHFFQRIKAWHVRWIVGCSVLGLLIFLFPSLYGEGYQTVNIALSGDWSSLVNNSLFRNYQEELMIVFLFFLAMILLKVIATAATFGAGGVGGIFAPALFTGVFTGLFFGKLTHYLGLGSLPEGSFALAGMGGVIAGVLHAPLTGIFLIAEITGGYQLFVPLMITCAISYVTVKIFVPNSVYTQLLAQKGELITHDKDKAVLTLMKVEDLIEKNFQILHPDDYLGDLVKLVSKSSRNLFPVVDEQGFFRGLVTLDDVRKIMFKPELYGTTYVSDLMVTPPHTVDLDDTMEEVTEKFQRSGQYVLAVVHQGRYIGFVSRANVFSEYREMLKNLTDE
ncbi:MAG TPA: chloride channel protein [Bacteroidales bacterium]|nr:chloride channel protein [Bacteroidales bacterium]HNS46736.1 chloride channel protein [Bacteroidales bacterium]